MTRQLETRLVSAPQLSIGNNSTAKPQSSSFAMSARRRFVGPSPASSSLAGRRSAVPRHALPQGSILQLNHHQLAPVEERDQQTVPQTIHLDLRWAIGAHWVVLHAYDLKDRLNVGA